MDTEREHKQLQELVDKKMLDGEMAFPHPHRTGEKIADENASEHEAEEYND